MMSLQSHDWLSIFLSHLLFLPFSLPMVFHQSSSYTTESMYNPIPYHLFGAFPCQTWIIFPQNPKQHLKFRISEFWNSEYPVDKSTGSETPLSKVKGNRKQWPGGKFDLPVIYWFGNCQFLKSSESLQTLQDWRNLDWCHFLSTKGNSAVHLSLIILIHDFEFTVQFLLLVAGYQHHQKSLQISPSSGHQLWDQLSPHADSLSIYSALSDLGSNVRSL